MQTLKNMIKKHSNNAPLALELLSDINETLFTDKEKENDLLQHMAISATMSGLSLKEVAELNEQFKLELLKASKKALDNLDINNLECSYTEIDSF